MLNRMDEWRARLQGRAPTQKPVRGATYASATNDAPRAAKEALASYGPCPACAGPREIVMQPQGAEASRLGLVCSHCGGRTDI